jgi:FtsH-binding integral membrane protein
MNELRPQRIIYAALLIALAIYFVLVWTLGQQNASRPFQDAVRQPIVIPMYAIGAATFAIAFFIRARFRERRVPPRVRNIVFWALLESISIYGVVLAFLYRDWRLMAPPLMVSILGFAMSFPQEEV